MNKQTNRTQTNRSQTNRVTYKQTLRWSDRERDIKIHFEDVERQTVITQLNLNKDRKRDTNYIEH